MDKLKDLWNKHKKIILILLFLLLLIGFILTLIFTKGFGLFKSKGLTPSKVGSYDLNEVDSYSYVWDFENDKALTVFGVVSDLSDTSFILKDPEEEDSQIIVYFVNPLDKSEIVNLGDISNNDYVISEGKWDTTYTALIAEKITKIDEDIVKDFIASKIPMLEIEILEHTENIAHTCDTPKFNIRLTNTGQIPISHKYLHDTDYGSGYRIYYFIDEDHHIANAYREDYEEVIKDLEDPKEIGLLSNLGFMYFDELAPGQSVDIEYWGGGQVTESLHRDMFNDDGSHRRAGVAGSPNIFGNYDVGEHEFSFAWARMNNYDDVDFLNRSNTVTVNLLDSECSLADEYITNTFWVEPL